MAVQTWDQPTGTSGTLRTQVEAVTDAANNRTTFFFTFSLLNSSAPTFVNGLGWSASANGIGNSGSVNIAGAGTYVLWSGSVGPINHDANGNIPFAPVFALHMNASGTSGMGGPTDQAVAVGAPRIPQAPGQPATPTVSSIATTSATINWTAPSRGHADITNYQYRVATDSAFSNLVAAPTVGNVLSDNTANDMTLQGGRTYYVGVRAYNADGYGPWSATRSFLTTPVAPTGLTATDITPVSLTLDWNNVTSATGYDIQYSTSSSFSGATTVTSTGSSRAISGLTPGTRYYFRVRAKNGSGAGSWSATFSQTMLPSNAPGMTVTPNVAGTGASVALTPPGGATGVTKYTVERRLGSSGTVTSTDTTTSPLSVSGLTPGATYQWRASAWFGTYQSPWTSWTPIVQPNPNTSPGDYFDGSTTARDDLTFSWTGTTNNSTSNATGDGVTGWSGGRIGGGVTTAVQRVTGGWNGAYAARMTFRTDAPGDGTFLGMAPTLAFGAAIQADALYVGSIYVRPSRAQSLRAELRWIDASGTEIGNTQGEDVLVTSTTNWTRLIVSGTAPAGAVAVAVRVRDMSVGTGWSVWLSGEWLDADSVMVSLAELFDWFSGGTTDTAEFNYAWLGTPNASVSARFVLDPADTDPLLDPDCPPLPTPPAMPTIEADCIEEVGTWRRYTLAIPSTEVREWSSTLPTLILETGDAAERQVRIRYYPNPDDDAAEMVVPNGWDAELILTYIPPNTVLTMDGVTQNVTAEVGGGDPISANRLLYGTGGVPATWPELRCGVGYIVTMDVPLDAPAGNLESRVIVTQRM